MKFVIFIYYFIYVITGGYRHFSFEFEFFAQFSNGQISQLDLKPFFATAESILLLLAFAILCFPLRKQLHLVFFLVLFVLDLFFQNFVIFDRSIILTHLFPLLVYFFLRYADHATQKEKAAHYGMLVLTVGYFSSFMIKSVSGWLNPSHLVVYSYINQFSTGYAIDGLTSRYFLQIHSPVFWKMADYAVLLFQFSSIFLFFNKAFYKWFSLAAFVFHLLILLCLEITVFYPYLLYYTLIIAYDRKHKESSGTYYGWIFVPIMLIGFILYKGDAHFLMRMLPLKLYEYINVTFTLGCSILFVYYWVAAGKSKTRRTLIPLK